MNFFFTKKMKKKKNDFLNALVLIKKGESPRLSNQEKTEPQTTEKKTLGQSESLIIDAKPAEPVKPTTPVIQPLKPTKRTSINIPQPIFSFANQLSTLNTYEKSSNSYDRSAQSSPIRKSPFSRPVLNAINSFTPNPPEQGTRFIIRGFPDITLVLICMSKQGQYVLQNLSNNCIEWRYPSELIEIGGPIDFEIITD